LQQITKNEKDWLIKNGYIKNQKGKYIDLKITQKNKKAKRKKYYTTTTIARNLKFMDGNNNNIK